MEFYAFVKNGIKSARIPEKYRDFQNLRGRMLFLVNRIIKSFLCIPEKRSLLNVRSKSFISLYVATKDISTANASKYDR